MTEERIANLDYFICYCGKDMPLGSVAREFANMLYDRLTACGKRVYFAPRMGHGDAYNSAETLNRIISGLSTSFIVLLTPRFFDDFDEQTGDGESPIKKEIATAMAEAKRRSSAGGGIKAFLKYVHIDGFDWQRSQKYIVRQLFEEYPINDYFDVSAFKCAPCLNDDGEQDKQKLEEEVREFVKRHLEIDIEREHSVAAYKRDVDLCFHTLIFHAQQFFHDEFFDYAKKLKSSTPALIANYDAYDKKLAKYGLYSSVPADTRCTSWQLFFTDTVRFGDGDDASARQSKLRRFQVGDSLDKDGTFNSCAVCFGALHTYNRLTGIGMAVATDDYTRTYFSECLRGAVNLIMFMQNDNGSWPEQKQLGKDKDLFSADNGLNQTTIAISTLLKIGFLRADNELLGSASDEVLENRFRAVMKGADWLLNSATHVETDDEAYWSVDGLQDGSTLMTAMCLDTFIKLASDPYVKSHLAAKYDFNELFIKMTRFFARMQNADGGIRPCIANSQSSFSHTAKVMNTLCTLWEFTRDADCKDIADDVINLCLPYLVNAVGDRLQNRDQHDFEQFNIPDCEDYEMSGEMLLITALTKILKHPPSSLGRLLNHDNYAVYKDDIARERLSNRLVELMNMHMKSHVVHFMDVTATEAILIRGKRKNEELQFPIYLLYYYHMALTELLDTLHKKSSADDTSAKSDKRAAA